LCYFYKEEHFDFTLMEAVGISRRFNPTWKAALFNTYNPYISLKDETRHANNLLLRGMGNYGDPASYQDPLILNN